MSCYKVKNFEKSKALFHVPTREEKRVSILLCTSIYYKTCKAKRPKDAFGKKELRNAPQFFFL